MASPREEAPAAARTVSSESPELLIVGGGPVGLALASMAAAAGLSAVLVEAAPVPGPGGMGERAIALSLGSAGILAGIGGGRTWERLRALVTPIRAVHAYERGRFGRTRIEAGELGLPALGYVSTGREIARALAEVVAKEACLRVLAPARLEVLQVRSGGVLARVETAQGPVELQARVAVGADGGQSLVRRLIGVPAQVHDYRHRALIANVTASEGHGGTAFECFTGQGPLALLPLGRRRLGLIWSASTTVADDLIGLDEGAFLARLERAFGPRLGRLVRAGPRVSFPLHLAVAAAQRHARVVLVGNAANHLHPVAGQGFNLGLRDAAALAQTLVEAVRAGGDVGAPSVLARYVARRAADQRRTVRLTHGLVETFSSDLPGLGLVRSGAMLALDTLPPLRRRFARRAMGLGPGRPAGRLGW